MPKITVYSRTTCGPCRTLKSWLKHKGIEFDERDIEDPAIAREMIGRSGITTVPLTFVGEDMVVGPNFSLINKLLML